MPYGDTSLEDVVLGTGGRTPAARRRNQGLVRDALSKYLADAQQKQNIQDRMFLENRDPSVFSGIMQEQNRVPYTYTDEYFHNRRLNQGAMDSSNLPTSWSGRKRGKYQREQSYAHPFGSKYDVVDALNKGLMKTDPITGEIKWKTGAQIGIPRNIDLLDIVKLMGEDFAVGGTRLSKRLAGYIGEQIDNAARVAGHQDTHVSDTMADAVNRAGAEVFTGHGHWAPVTAFKGAVNTGSTDLRGTLTDIVNAPLSFTGFGLEGNIARGLITGGVKATNVAAKAGRAGRIGGKMASAGGRELLSQASRRGLMLSGDGLGMGIPIGFDVDGKAILQAMKDAREAAYTGVSGQKYDELGQPIIEDELTPEDLAAINEATRRPASSARRGGGARDPEGLAIESGTRVTLPGEEARSILTSGTRSGGVDPRQPFPLGEDVSGFQVTNPDALHGAYGRTLENTGRGTISDRLASDLSDVNIALTNADLPPLSVKATGGRPGELRVSDYDKELYDAATIQRNIDIAAGTHPEGYDLFKLENELGKNVHLMENDHLIGAGFASWVINQRFKALKGQKPTQAWREEQEQFLKWINSGENMQRVGRLWNQVKNGQDFWTAAKAFKERLPKAAEAQFTPEYLDYVRDAIYGIGPDSLASTIGRDMADRVLKLYKDPAYLEKNFSSVLERQTPEILWPVPWYR